MSCPHKKTQVRVYIEYAIAYHYTTFVVDGKKMVEIWKKKIRKTFPDVRVESCRGGEIGVFDVVVNGEKVFSRMQTPRAGLPHIRDVLEQIYAAKRGEKMKVIPSFDPNCVIQ